MAMEISNNYGNYYAGMADDTKKEGSRVSEDTKSAKGSGKGNVQEYYEKLCKKFPQISFNTNGGEMRCGSNQVVVNLSYDCLKKMANDSEFAKKIEWNLSGEVAANNMVYSNAKRDGVELGGRTVTYDGNGNRQSSCGGMRTANTGNNNNQVRNRLEEQNEKIKKKREERKALEERLTRKRAEKKAIEERAAKRRAEKEQAEERIAGVGTGEVRISATGNSVESATKSVMSAISANVGAGAARFDVKA